MGRATSKRCRLGLLALAALSTPGALGRAESLLIDSFESAGDLARWDVDGAGELSSRHVTHGEWSLRVVWPSGRGRISRGFPSDWSGWELLKLDCTNPGPPFFLALRVEDASGATAESTAHYVRTGRSTLDFVVRGLAERVDVAQISSALLALDPPAGRSVQVYLDNLRFTRDEPSAVYQPPPEVTEARASSPPQVAEGLLANGGFEHGLVGWEAAADARTGGYRVGTETGSQAYAGYAAAAIIRIQEGCGGLVSAPFVLPADDVYELSLRVKGSVGGAIRVVLETSERQDVRQALAGTKWQEVRELFVGAQGETGRIYLLSCAPGTMYFDQVCMRGGRATQQRREQRRDAPDNRANPIPNPDFEDELKGWDKWGEWDGGLYEFAAAGPQHAYSGQGAAAVICRRAGRGGLISQAMTLTPQARTLRFMARGSQPSSIRYGVVCPGARVFRDSSVGTEWREFTLQVPCSEEGAWRVYLMSTGPGTVYFDEVSLRGPRDILLTAATVTAAPTRLEVRQGRTLLNTEPFFALGLRGAPPAACQDTPFNCVLPWGAVQDDWLEQCRHAGVWCLPNLEGLMRGHLPQRAPQFVQAWVEHPAVIGWALCEDPTDLVAHVPPDEVRLATRLLRDLDPAHVTTCLVNPAAESHLFRYADAVDIMTVLLRPFADGACADLSAMWQSVALAQRAVTEARPIWAMLEVDERGSCQAHIAAAYGAVVGGADGLFFSDWQQARRSDELWACLCATARELRALASALTATDSTDQPAVSHPAVQALCKAGPEGRILLAVNTTAQTLTGCRLLLPGLPDREARVLFEDRTVSCQGGALFDDFAPFARHVYQLP